VSVHTSLVGPLQLDDLFVVELYAPTTANYFVLGAVFAAGLHDRTVVCGINDTDITFDVAVFDHDIAPGDALTIRAFVTHHDLASIDGPTDFTGFVWDSTSALYVLSGGQGVDLSQVLAAIYRTFPSS